MAAKPRILFVGSCRISRPLRVLHEWGIIQLTNYYRPWFAHSAGEGLQYVRLLKGEPFPDQLRPYTDLPSVEERADLTSLFAVRALDMVFVEISLMRSLTVDGHFVHFPRVGTAAEEAGLSISAAVSGEGAEWPEGHPLARLKVSYDSEADVASGLAAIKEASGAPRVATLDHIFTRNADGQPLPSRQKISDTLALVQSRDGIPYFRTQSVIEKHGFDVATYDGYHYNEDFEKVIATYYWGFMAPLL